MSDWVITPAQPEVVDGWAIERAAKPKPKTIEDEAAAAGGLPVKPPSIPKVDVKEEYVPGLLKPYLWGVDAAAATDKALTEKPADTTTAKIAKGVGRSAMKAGRALKEPKNLAIMGGLAAVNAAQLIPGSQPVTIPLAQAANATAATYFGAEMASQIPQQYGAYNEALKRGDTGAAAESLGDIGITSAMAVGAGRGGVELAKPAVAERMGVAKPTPNVTPRAIESYIQQREAEIPANRKAALEQRFGTAAERKAALDEQLAADKRTQPVTEAEWPITKAAEESARVFEQEPPKSAQESASTFRKELNQRPVVPESGIPENILRVQDARERMAQQYAGKPWSELSNPERLQIDEWIREGNQGAINDRQNTSGLSSQERVGQEPVQADALQGGSAEAAQTGRVLQTPGRGGLREVGTTGIRPTRRRGSGQAGTLPLPESIFDKKSKEKPVEEKYLNFGRVKLSPEEEANLRREYQMAAEESAIPEKYVEPLAAVKGKAAGLSEADVQSGLKRAALSLEDRAAVQAARHRINTLNRELYKMEGDLQRDANTLPPEQVDALSQQIDAKRADLRKYQSALEGSRSSAGRSLRIWGEMADAGWDFASWAGRAKRELGLRPQDELPSKVRGKVQELTDHGMEAEGRLDTALTESGYDLKTERALAEKQDQLSQAIAEREGAAATNTQAQAEVAAARKELRRVRDQYNRMLVRREEMLSGIPRLKKIAGDVQQAKVSLRKEMDALTVDGWADLVSTMLKATPLLNAKTHERNFLGTLVHTHGTEVLKSYPSAIIDAAQSAFGKSPRTTVAVTPGMYLRALRAQFTNGLREAKEVSQYGAPVADIMAGDRMRELNFQKPYIPKPISDAVNNYTHIIFRTLNAEDRINRAFSVQLALETQAKTLAINEAKSGAIKRGEIGKRMQQILSDPPADMIANAEFYGSMATFNAHNPIASAINSARMKMHPVARIPFDAVVRYVRTPINVVNMMTLLDPVIGPARGIAKAAILKGELRSAKKSFAESKSQLSEEGYALRAKELAELDKKISAKAKAAYTSAIGSGAVGAGLMMLGYYLSKEGLMTAYSAEQSPGERGVNESSGRPAASILIGGKWRRFDMLAPVSVPVLMGASLAESEARYGKQVRKNPYNLYAQLAWAAGQGLLELPMNKGLKDIQEMFRSPDTVSKKSAGWVKSQIGSLIPPALTDADKQARSMRGEGIKDSRGSELQYRVPGLRGQLPERLDVFGEPVKENDLPILDAFNSTAPKQEPIYAELRRLGIGVTKPIEGTIYALRNPANGASVPFESKTEALSAKDELEHEGIRVEVTAATEPEDRHRARHQLTGALMKQAAIDVISSPEYQQLTDNEKKNEINKAFSSARAEVRDLIQDPEFYSLPQEKQVQLLTKALSLIKQPKQ